MQYKGIDISAWQGQIDWDRVKASGIQFAIIRAGYGKGNIDKYAKRNLSECNRVGIPAGVYWFSYAYNEDMARKEADYCIDLIKAYKVEYPIYFDYEYDSVSYSKRQGVTPSASLVKRLVSAFCSQVETRGYYAGNYANLDYLSTYGMGDLTSKYDLWLAQWASSHSKSCGMWQYSASGSVPGISGGVDMDVSYIDYPSVIRKAGLNGLKSDTADTTTAQTDTAKSDTTQPGVSADDVIAVMQSWIGKSRSAGTHKDIIDLYNSISPLPVGYRVTYSDAYCDAGLSAAYHKCGAVDLVCGGECGVERHVQLFQAAGLWEEDGTITPSRGDIIVYNWDSSTQPNDGNADHIGIVESVDGSTITAIECNINGGQVGRRTLQVGNGYIRGYAKPKYTKTSGSGASQSTPALSTPVKSYPYGKASSTTGILKRGSRGTAVQAVQHALNCLGYGNSGTRDIYGRPDGIYGVKTESAVVAFQRDYFPSDRREWDGRVGPKTRAKFKAAGY